MAITPGVEPVPLTDDPAVVAPDPTADGEAPPPEAPPLPLLELSDGVPPVVVADHDLRLAVDRLQAGTGPLAVDAERASGYRYSQRAYLVQLRRAGSGTVLIDPIACPDLSSVDAAIADAEWVVHAASQDLPSLLEVGLRPRRLFDTELAARLAGFERVGLATMVPLVLGVRLEKGHSAADWSQRPLTESMLLYAALDVEPLVALRDHLEQLLREQGKWDWAQEEFAAVAAAPAPRPRTDPWRRTSGIHRLRTRRQLAAVRALWNARDEIARRSDVAPGRVLPDAAIIEAALAGPAAPAELEKVPGFSGRATRRRVPVWFAALAAAAALPDAELPPPAVRDDATPPPAHRWAERDPVAAQRLARLRTALVATAAAQALPVENLLEPAALRRLAWTPPAADASAVAGALAAVGARAWQIALVTDAVVQALG